MASGESLKVGDIDGDRNVFWIRGGKGINDQQAMLPDTLRTSQHIP